MMSQNFLALLMPLSVTLMLWILNYRIKKRIFSVSSISILIYIISGSFAFLVSELQGDVLSVRANLILTLGLMAVLTPLLFFPDGEKSSLCSYPRPSTVLSWGLALISVISTIYFLQFLPKIFDLGVGDQRMLLARGLIQAVEETSVLHTLSTAVTSCYILVMALFFVNATAPIPNRPLLVLLFIGSLCEPLRVASLYGRDGVVFWILPMVQMYLLFKSNLNKVAKRWLSVLFLNMVAIFLVMFSVVTYSRFGLDSKQEGVTSSLISYIGQSFVNYTDVYFFSDYVSGNGSVSFPWLKNLVGLDSSDGEQVSKAWLEIYSIDSKFGGVFGTFMREWTIDFGPSGALLLAIGVGICMSILFWVRRNTMSFTVIYAYFFYNLFLIQGVFYFRMKYNNTNLAIFVVVLMLIFEFLARLLFLPPGRTRDLPTPDRH